MLDKQAKSEQAARLAAERATRSPQQQLAELDLRLGKGEGAKKERARLKRLIDNPSLAKKAKGKKDEEVTEQAE
jgi:hypothetical protein